MVTLVNGNVVADRAASSRPPHTGCGRFHDENLAGARGDRLIDCDYLAGSPVSEPEPALMPTRRFHIRKTVQQDTGRRN
jgi:hypothetical protein